MGFCNICPKPGDCSKCFLEEFVCECFSCKRFRALMECCDWMDCTNHGNGCQCNPEPYYQEWRCCPHGYMLFVHLDVSF